MATFFLGAAFFTAFLAGFSCFLLAFMFCFLGVFCLLGGAVFWWMNHTSLNLSSTFSFTMQCFTVLLIELLRDWQLFFILDASDLL